MSLKAKHSPQRGRRKDFRFEGCLRARMGLQVNHFPQKAKEREEEEEEKERRGNG